MDVQPGPRIRFTGCTGGGQRRGIFFFAGLMVFTQWQRARLAAVLGDMGGTPAQVELVAPLMDQLELAADDDQRAAALAPGAELANANLPITPAQAQLLLGACRIWPGWTVAERGQMRCLLNDLSMAAEDQRPDFELDHVSDK